MSYNGNDLTPDPLFLQTGSYDAKSDRKTTSDEISAGVVGGGDYAVTYSGGTLVMNVAAGVAYVKGGNVADQGAYRQYISAGTTVTCPIADPSNPRIDTIILRVLDNAADGSTFNKGRVECVPGTPNAASTLTNLTGKNPLTSLTDVSLSFIVLAYVLVPAGATTLTSTTVNVRDARSVAKVGSSSVSLDPIVALGVGGQLDFNSNAETDWIGGVSTGLVIPTVFPLGSGSRFIVEAEGIVTVKLSTAPTHRFKVYLDSTNIIDSGAFAIWASTATPIQVPWSLKLDLRNSGRTSGGSWQYLCIVDLEFGDVTGTNITQGNGTQKTKLAYKWDSGTKLFTAATLPANIRFTHAWGTADAANSITMETYKTYLL